MYIGRYIPGKCTYARVLHFVFLGITRGFLVQDWIVFGLFFFLLLTFAANETHVLQTWCKTTLNFHKLIMLDPLTKKCFLSGIFLFTVVDAAGGFGDLQLKVKWKFLFILQ